MPKKKTEKQIHPDTRKGKKGGQSHRKDKNNYANTTDEVEYVEIDDLTLDNVIGSDNR